MLVLGLDELKIIDVYDRGIPNKERIVIRSHQELNIGRYGIMLGYKCQPNTSSGIPVRDNLFWFGDGIVKPSSWLIIYTGSGEPIKTVMQNSNDDAYVMHWGKPETIFADTNYTPILFRVDAVDVMPPPKNMPQHQLEKK